MQHHHIFTYLDSEIGMQHKEVQSCSLYLFPSTPPLETEKEYTF